MTQFQHRKDNPSDDRRAVGYFEPDVTAITKQLNFRRARSNPFAQINMQFVLDVQDRIFLIFLRTRNVLFKIRKRH